jgi:DNA-directed RNA polymerase subunit L
MMRDRLTNIPVLNVDPGFVMLHEKYWKNVDYLDVNRLKHEKERLVEVFIDAKNPAIIENDKKSILHVTTNDIKTYVDGKLTDLYSKEYPFLIISLKPKEAFKCSMKAVLGTGQTHTCWDACSNFCYDQETIENKTIVKFQSGTQFNEFVLVERALEYLTVRTGLLKDEVHRLYLEKNKDTERFQIIIENEDHTMGEIINYEIQSHPNILKSSVSKPNYLINNILLDVVAFEKDKLLNSILESFDNLIVKIDKFRTEFKKIKIPDSDTIPEVLEEPKKKSQKEKK